MVYTKAFVTGGAGFIGSHLVDALVAQGTQVTVLDLVEPLDDRKNLGVTYIKGDIRDRQLVDIMQTAAPEVVFHLAAQINDRSSDALANAEHNELGSANVFAAAEQVGVKTIVFASTCAVYGLPETLPITESALPRPRTPYGISKWAAEHYLDALALRTGITAVALRFANAYGPRQDGNHEAGATAVFTSKLLAGEPPFLNGDGTSTRDYLFVGDIVSSMLVAADNQISGVFNVGTGREVSTRDLYRFIQERTGSTLEPIPRPQVRDAAPRVVLDASLFTRTFGWQPTVTLEEGIEKTVAWYQNGLR